MTGLLGSTRRNSVLLIRDISELDQLSRSSFTVLGRHVGSGNLQLIITSLPAARAIGGNVANRVLAIVGRVLVSLLTAVTGLSGSGHERHVGRKLTGDNCGPSNGGPGAAGRGHVERLSDRNGVAGRRVTGTININMTAICQILGPNS